MAIYTAIVGFIVLLPSCNRGKLFLFFVILAGVVFFGVYAVQNYSLVVSGQFVNSLAFENILETQYISSKNSIIIATVGVVFWVLIFSTLAAREKNENFDARLIAPGAIVSFTALLYVVFWSVALGGVTWRPQKMPFYSFVKSIVGYYRYSNLDYSGVKASSIHTEYPFEKKYVFQDRLPFVSRQSDLIHPNVIIIFSEGVSARFFKEYGGIIPGLMPNMDAYFHKFMRVDNYYSHTAATFRGLQGQLTSGYPYYGGAMRGGWAESGEMGVRNATVLARRSYQSLPFMLRDLGYKSFFFSPHPNTNTLNSMLSSLGFDDVISAETLGGVIGRPIALNSGTQSATDEDIFIGLIEFLKKRDQCADNQPFLACTYNIGTHAFLGAHKGGKPFGDRTNKIFDRFHNLDNKIELFLKYFFSSRYLDNTILIITSDHAAYPEPGIVHAFRGTDFQPYFVDRIPFLIYSPLHDLPCNYDATGKTSLDFAPTVLHLLNVKTGRNSFLGHSIFENRNRKISVTAIGHDYYIISGGKIKKPEELSGPLKSDFNEYRETIELYYGLEKADKIFNKHSRVRGAAGGDH